MSSKVSNRLQEKLVEAVAEGLANNYQATDDDLPRIFWPEGIDVEKEFWESLENKL